MTTPSDHARAQPSDRHLAGRTVLVTGAAGDIGSSTSIRLAAAGAHVVVADLSNAVGEVARQCGEVNPDSEHTTLQFDVTEPDDVARAFDELNTVGVAPDLLFNNAGYQGAFGNILDYDATDFRRVLDINVTGAFLVLKRFARDLVATSRPGAVVNMASMAHGGAPNMVAYSASKAAVVALTKSAAKDLAPHSIRVNSVSPAFIGPGAMWERQVQLQAETASQYFSDDAVEVADQMIQTVPLRRYGSLDEVASVVEFLLSGASSYITAFDIEVSGGAT